MTRPSLFSMAWRNLWRNRRRTFLTLSSIAFGVFLAIIATGMQDMNWRDMIDMAARLGAGHVTVQHEGFVDAPTLSRTVRASPELMATVTADADVRRVVTRISGGIMLATAGQSYGAGFIAIDPRNEDADTLSILEAMDEGALFAESDARKIVLGGKLADNLDARLGKKIVFTLTDKDGEIVQDVVRVSGILRTGSPGVDGGLVLLPIDRLRESLGYAPDEVTQVGLFLTDQRRADTVTERVGANVGDGAATLAWHATQPDVAAFIAMKIAGARILQVIIATLVAAGIFNTLFVSVMERLREFGILLAVGFSPGRLFRLVMLESAWFGVLGLVAAALVTAVPYYYLSTHGLDMSALMGEQGAEVAGIGMSPVLRFGLYAENMALILGAALVATLLAGLYPAYRAAHVAPVESIRLV